jgi:hypothetical protein
MLLTPRDAEIVRLVARHRFLRSTHIISLAGGSPQQLLRRMQLLFHHGYLERPRAQLDYFYQGGSKAMVYGLGKEGGAVLHSKPTPERQRRPHNPSSIGRVFLNHALMVADVMVAIELACRRHGGIRLLTGDGIPLPAKSKTRIEPFHWSVQLADRTKLGVIPDSVFVLEFGDQPNERDRILYFLEADRATMPVARPNLARSSFRRKLVAYEATWAQSLHQSRFGFLRFRVFTVTTSAARVASLAAACGQLSRGRGLFLFTDIASLSARADLLTLPFQSGHAGKVATLLD